MKVDANIKYLRISAQKLRLSANIVRGRRAIEAQEILLNMPQKSSHLVGSGLKSAIANAENNYNLSPANLIISEIRVGEGPKLKRGRPRAKGSYGRIIHPMAHLHIILDSGDQQPKSQGRAKTANRPTAQTVSKPKVTTKITTKKRGRK